MNSRFRNASFALMVIGAAVIASVFYWLSLLETQAASFARVVFDLLVSGQLNPAG